MHAPCRPGRRSTDRLSRCVTGTRCADSRSAAQSSRAPPYSARCSIFRAVLSGRRCSYSRGARIFDRPYVLLLRPSLTITCVQCKSDVASSTMRSCSRIKACCKRARQSRSGHHALAPRGVEVGRRLGCLHFRERPASRFLGPHPVADRRQHRAILREATRAAPIAVSSYSRARAPWRRRSEVGVVVRVIEMPVCAWFENTSVRADLTLHQVSVEDRSKTTRRCHASIWRPWQF